MRVPAAIVFVTCLALPVPAAAASDWLLGDPAPARLLPQDASFDGELSRFTISFWSGLEQGRRQFSDPERARSGFGASARHHFGEDATSWWGLDTRLGVKDPIDPIVDRHGWQLGISAGRGWNTGFDLRGRIDYERGHQQFDQSLGTQSWRASAELDYAWSEHWGLFAGLGYRRGTGNGNGGSDQNLWSSDSAMSPGWRTYQTSARTVTFTFGAHIDLGPATQFLVAWQRLDGRVRDTGFELDSSVYRLQLQHGF